MTARQGELLLAAALVCAAAGLTALDHGSSVATALRQGRPVTALLSFDAESPGSRPTRYYLAYRPAVRALDILALPPDWLKQLPAFPPPDFELNAAGPAPEDPSELRRRIEEWPRGPRFFAAAAAWARRSPAAADPYGAALLILEAYRLAPADVRLLWIPPAELRERLSERLFGPEPPAAEPSSLRVEVQNASGEPGVALAATKVLRWREADVIDYGNAQVQDASRLVDRAGRPQDARRVGELLGCPGLEVWTRLESPATAPVAVVLGRDWRRCRRLAP